MKRKKDFIRLFHTKPKNTGSKDESWKPYSGKFIVIPNKHTAIIKIKKEDSLLNQLFSEIKNNGYAKYFYTNETKERWRKTSSIIGNICKDITKTENRLLFPPTTNRYAMLGMIVKPKDVRVDVETKNNMNIYTLKRTTKKLF